MIVIVESGASKCDWCAVSPGGDALNVRTEGMNLATMTVPAVEEVVRKAVTSFERLSRREGFRGEVTEVHFYAAGLIVPEDGAVPPLAAGLDGVLRGIFPGASIEYASDLLAAARSVCGHRSGIAAILGTGSNSCLFDGEKIVRNVRSAGFILGDEGGGATLGKMFMADFLKGLVPEPIASEFASSFEVDYMTVVRKVYREEAPSKYLGSFAPWILARYEPGSYIAGLVELNFRNFIERALLQYDIASYSVGVVGGFGHAHQEILRKVAEPYGIRFSSIIAAPIEGLVAYHLGNN